MQLQTICNGKPFIKDFDEEFHKECDVCVVGLGTAGAISAISAAKTGVSVIGVERTSLLGGMGGAACVWDFFYGTQGGMATEINEDCYKKINDLIYASSGGRVIRDESLPSIVKDSVLRSYAQKYGCELMLEAVAVAVISKDNTICGVRIFDGNRHINIGCKVLIDGTDGAVCRLAGCEFNYGRPRDNHTMQFSHMAATYSDKMIRGSWNANGFPEVTSQLEWSQKILGSAPSYHGERVVYEAEILGTREVPTVITDMVYTLDDYINGTTTDKPLFYGFAPVDNTNPDIENECDSLLDFKFLCKLSRFGISVGIPVETMLPKGKDALMIVSRAKGLGHDLSSCIRMKYDLEKSGEAAGRISAIACKKGCSLREVPYDELRPLLEETGCLNHNQNVGLCDLNEPYIDPQNGRLWGKYPMPQTVMEYKVALSSKEPGPAMWNLRCGYYNKEILDSLTDWLDDSNTLLRENSSIVLGMLGKKEAIPVLLDIISKAPVGYFYCVPKVKHCYGWLMESPFSNFTKAIVLLGRFKEQRAVPILESIIADQGNAVAQALTADDRFMSKELFAKHVTSFAQVALKDIKNTNYN